MPELSLITLKIIAGAKIILFIFIFFTLLNLFKKNKPYIYLIISTVSISSFYLILSWQAKKMFWGNNGDEVFIFSYLTKILNGGLFSDFYYSWLPQFYPPLYFWVTGAIARLFTDNGISAAKIGVLMILSVWFIGPYIIQKIYWLKNKSETDGENKIINKNWFWLLGPVIFFLLLDFDAIVLKPYEAITAIFGVTIIGLIAESLNQQAWGYKKYIFFGVNCGITFLTYYFWWFIFIPTLFFLCLQSKEKNKCFYRIIFLGIIILFVSLPYLLPLILSYIKYGMENWQALFFVPQDLFTFAPWAVLSLKLPLLIAGLIGLIYFHKNKFIKANLLIFIFCYFYQFLNIIFFLLGHKPFQSSKPFLFLSTASLSVGAAYFLIFYRGKISNKFSDFEIKTAAAVIIIIFLSLMPFTKLIDDPVVITQIEKNFLMPNIYKLIPAIKKVEGYNNFTWLSSGAPELNAYLPLSYYIAHNPHFSHHASIYSKRMEELIKLSKSRDADEFMDIVNLGSPKKIDALLLFYDKKNDAYPLSFWQDNYPNGGKELIINLPAKLISDNYWRKAFDNGEWKIFIKK